MDLRSFITNFTASYKPRLKGVLFLFAASAVLGAVAVWFYPELMEEIIASFSERFGPEPALDSTLALQIFQQNVTVSLIAWLGGLILAVPPVLIVLSNGFIIGFVIAYLTAAIGVTGQSLVVLGAGLLPHAILEIPAFLAAAALGMALGLDWLKAESRGMRLKTLWQSLKATSVYFLIIIIALFIAAWIEVFISGNLVDKLA